MPFVSKDNNFVTTLVFPSIAEAMSERLTPSKTTGKNYKNHPYYNR